MGMEHVVLTSSGKEPGWPALRDFLGQRGYPVQLRMINGELAFPDEQPAADWRELRLGTPGGMITLRREPARLLVVTWGNADLALRQAWNAVALALAVISQGQVQTGDRILSPEQFQESAELPSLNLE